MELRFTPRDWPSPMKANYVLHSMQNRVRIVATELQTNKNSKIRKYKLINSGAEFEVLQALQAEWSRLAIPESSHPERFEMMEKFFGKWCYQ